ncbi:hypothetical protein M0802_000316 [Mischocyttarus mexicanus]|nr:hypothetical protein M0802_000316 [Mischocyttarus mexicanus]
MFIKLAGVKTRLVVVFDMAIVVGRVPLIIKEEEGVRWVGLWGRTRFLFQVLESQKLCGAVSGTFALFIADVAPG